ncbi:MAG TPA: hypothetical protein VFI88_01550 [Sphingomicrobium sp.]|jgi:hypothetical protein|nr:hypothetical protein [Sphingomicrobium sp.]
MTAVKTLAIGAAGVAALLGASAPAAAQYYPSYPGYPAPKYGQTPSYGYPYGGPTPYGAYGNRGNEQYLVQLCTNAVNQRLNYRGYGSYGGYSGYGNARVLGITDIDQRDGSALRIRGEATSGYGNPYGGYGYPYGAGAYAQARPDIRFSCEVDYRGYVRDVDLDRR